MGLYQPTVIAPSSLNGTGVIDATQDMTVTFQINGTVPIYGWRFVIMENTVESTVLYNSGWRHDYITVEGQQVAVYTYGRDGYGNPVPKTDTISAADLATAGIVNNYANGYKLRVDQQYSEYEHPDLNNTTTTKELVQISPVFFITRRDNAFMDTWLTIRGRYVISNFNLEETPGKPLPFLYDPLFFGRFRLADADDPDNHILNDTGNIYLPQNQSMREFGILDNGRMYAARATGQLESGAEVDTGWYDFTPTWTDTALSYVHLRTYYVRNTPAIYVRLEVDDGHDPSVITSPAAYRGWEIYRVPVNGGEKEKVGVIPRGQTAMYDFGAKNNTAYRYRAYYGLAALDGYCYESERDIKMVYYWNWALIECEKSETKYYCIPSHTYTNTMFHVKRVHQFQGNVDSGPVSNENEPFVENNFTPYPTVQKSARKGLSGTLKAWVGRTRNGVFSDSVEEVDRIMDLSTRDTVKFLRDRKGNLRMIEIGDAIRKETQDPYGEQPVEVQIPWVEVGDAKGCQIVSMVEDGLIAPGDDIVDTETAISEDEDGYIEWTRDDEGYVGSEIEMDADGNLVQKYNDDMTYVPAELEIDGDGKLKGTTVIDAEE